MLARPAEFPAAIVRIIKQQRSALRLPEISEPLTDPDVMAPTGNVAH